MSAREEILKRLRANTRETYDKPDLSQLKPITYADPVAEFISKTTTTAGAKLIEMKAGDDLAAIVRQIAVGGSPSAVGGSPVDTPASRAVGGSPADTPAPIIASNLPDVKADVNPDTVSSAQELMKVDVGVVAGTIGVAENACVWIPQQTKEKAVNFAVQQLVIVLPRTAIVNNMHEAYTRIEASVVYFQEYKFGTFISGPSKTADIEGALVYGAQAARALTVILTP